MYLTISSQALSCTALHCIPNIFASTKKTEVLKFVLFLINVQFHQCKFNAHINLSKYDFIT